MNFYRIAKLIILAFITPTLAFLAALQLRFEFHFSSQVEQQTIWVGLLLLILTRSFSYISLGAANVVWRYFSINELLAFLKAQLTSSILFTATVFLFRLDDLPRSIILIEFMLSVLMNVSCAALVRLLFEHGLYPLKQKPTQRRKDCLILGGEETGHLLLKNLMSQSLSLYRVVGILDDSQRLRNATIHGIKVLGPISQLETTLQKYLSIETIFLANSSLSRKKKHEIKALCSQKGISLKYLQPFEEIAVHVSNLDSTEVPIEAILDREVTFQHEESVLNTYEKKTILITGGAGSIGSEVTRQLASMNVKKLLVLDNSEYHLFSFQQELIEKYPRIPFEIILGDIRDQKRINAIFAEHSPEIVIHTAAYKHVPLSEDNPYEAFSTNVIGTIHIAQACVDSSVERFILLSTDKAVEPMNTMGKTKRLAEQCVQNIICRSTHETKGAIVRFGNVINSRGSVIPLFQNQILSGGPITVTDPNVERFFMSVQEAVRLMLAAGTLGERAEIFALDMGDKLKIKDIAEKLKGLYGREDIPIVYTGLRPGERLTENIYSPHEKLSPTQFDKVSIIRSSFGAPDSLPKEVYTLLNYAASSSREELSTAITNLLLTHTQKT